MLKRFKITSCAFILCLFGVTLTTVSPVLAEDSTEFQECQRIKPNGTNRLWLMEKKDCFRDLARRLSAANFAQEPLIEKSTDTASQLLAPNADQEDLSVKISELEGKLATAVSQSLYDETVQNYRQKEAELTAANTKNLELEGKLATWVYQPLYDETVQRLTAKKVELTAANTKSFELEANIASMRAQLADKDKQLLTLKTQAAEAANTPQQRLSKNGNDPSRYSQVVAIGSGGGVGERGRTVEVRCEPPADESVIITPEGLQYCFVTKN